MDGEDLAGSGEALSPDSLGLGDAASVDEGLVRMLKPEGKHSPDEMHLAQQVVFMHEHLFQFDMYLFRCRGFVDRAVSRISARHSQCCNSICLQGTFRLNCNHPDT